MTPAEAIFELTADDSGGVDLAKAATAIIAAVTDLVDNQGAKLTGNQAVELLTYTITHISGALSEYLMSTQAAVISAHQAIEKMLYGTTEIESFDEEVELATMLLSFDVARKARTLDMLSDSLEDAGASGTTSDQG